MFKTVKRIIDWCGKFKGRLYAGFVCSFFSHIFAALPLMVAAYTVGLLVDAQKTGAAFDTSWIWKCIVIQVVLVLLRFFCAVPRSVLSQLFGDVLFILACLSSLFCLRISVSGPGRRGWSE